MKRKLRRIKIGGFVYTIKWDYVFPDRTDIEGICDNTKNEIRIKRGDGGGTEFSDAHNKKIFWHEMLHAVAFAHRIPEIMLDENNDLVDRIACALLDLFENNPKILEELNGIEK